MRISAKKNVTNVRQAIFLQYPRRPASQRNVRAIDDAEHPQERGYAIQGGALNRFRATSRGFFSRCLQRTSAGAFDGVGSGIGQRLTRPHST